MKLPAALSEEEALDEIRSIAKKNKLERSFIGEGFYGTYMPTVILRNVYENPGWYTGYTPYQAEISQGRLEGLLNFQTMICDLTGLPIANSSLLDEATAAAEAYHIAHETCKRKKFFVSQDCHPSHHRRRARARAPAGRRGGRGRRAHGGLLQQGVLGRARAVPQHLR